MDTLKNYINGKWVKSLEETIVDVVNPANQEVLTIALLNQRLRYSGVLKTLKLHVRTFRNQTYAGNVGIIERWPGEWTRKF